MLYIISLSQLFLSLWFLCLYSACTFVYCACCNWILGRSLHMERRSQTGLFGNHMILCLVNGLYWVLSIWIIWKAFQPGFYSKTLCSVAFYIFTMTLMANIMIYVTCSCWSLMSLRLPRLYHKKVAMPKPARKSNNLKCHLQWTILAKKYILFLLLRINAVQAQSKLTYATCKQL